MQISLKKLNKEFIEVDQVKITEYFESAAELSWFHIPPQI
jgi:hypothetical protein